VNSVSEARPLGRVSIASFLLTTKVVNWKCTLPYGRASDTETLTEWQTFAKQLHSFWRRRPPYFCELNGDRRFNQTE